jgi:hypothetical protein
LDPAESVTTASTPAIETVETTRGDARTRVRQAGAAALTAGSVYAGMVWLTTQVPSVRAASPWQNDPYDAIATIGGQVVIAVWLLTFVRLARYRRAPDMPLAAMRYVVRGSWILLSIAAVSCVADAIAWSTHAAGRLHAAQRLHPGAAKAPLVGLIVTAAVVSVAALWAASAERSKRILRRADRTSASPDRGGAPDVFEDAAVVVERSIEWLRGRVPRLAEPAARAWSTAGRFVGRIGWASPRAHPWRFATLAGVAAGLGLALAHAVGETPSRGGSSLGLAALVWLVFVLAETSAALIGFALLRRFLGIASAPRGRARQSDVAI